MEGYRRKVVSMNVGICVDVLMAGETERERGSGARIYNSRLMALKLSCVNC